MKIYEATVRHPEIIESVAQFPALNEEDARIKLDSYFEDRNDVQIVEIRETDLEYIPTVNPNTLEGPKTLQ